MFEEHNWNESVAVAVAVAVALLHLAFRNNILAASRSFIFPSSNDSFDDFQRTPRIHKQNVCNEISMYFQHHLDEHFTHAIEFLYGFWFTNEVFWKRFDCFGENISCVNADVLINRCRTQKASKWGIWFCVNFNVSSVTRSENKMKKSAFGIEMTSSNI